ncbi:hypothetical protein [Butyrivibrio fibrisolvens]|uniref:hypothetical protein n=1 Tax=Butyrivibrio fibrisolvens TaxID=831 RepID=UPI0012BBACAD|nr:hypothetical protein [Butyrivibrio fibrisolvens]
MIDASRFNDIMEDLRKLPENSDRITAYGCPEEYEGPKYRTGIYSNNQPPVK